MLSMFGTSCVPRATAMNNVRYTCPDILVVQHCQVNKGEEVTINFDVALGNSAKERKSQMKWRYGIECR